MKKNRQEPSSTYSPQLLDFASIGVAFASVVEQGGEQRQYIERLLGILPRLYASVLELPDYFYSPGEDLVEEYITEQSYDNVRQRAEAILAADDLYLSASSADIQYSDTPIATHISEQLADVYQHVGNLLGVIREQNELALPTAIGRCKLYWREYWGNALLSVLSPLHQLYATLSEEDDYADDPDELDVDSLGYDSSEMSIDDYDEYND